MRYGSPAALRQSLDDRLRNEAEEKRIDLQRLRRRAAFERLLVRLMRSAPRRWVLKGGMALELRLGNRARVTKDLDLALLDSSSDHPTIRTALIEPLSEDPENDWFEFRVAEGTPLNPDEAGRPGVRFPVEVLLAGRTFAKVRVDVVARADEITATERILRPSVLEFADKAPIEVEVVAPEQHFAEKLHALTREYGDGGLSSRVKDLPDIIILIEDGLEPSTLVMSTVQTVFQARSTHQIPSIIPFPPQSWAETYQALAEDLDIEPKTIDAAMDVLQRFWAKAQSQKAEV